MVDDIDQNGWPDLILNDRADYGVLISNLGHRSFGPPRITHHVDSTSYLGDSIYDTTENLVRLDKSSFQFFNRGDISVTPRRFTPCAVPVDGGGHYGKRIILGETSTKPWAPLDLDGDGITEFIQQDPNSTTGKDFLIHDRQPDGSYLPLRVTFSHPLEVDKISLCDLDLDGDLDLSCLVNYNQLIFERTGTRSFASEGIHLEGYYHSLEPPVDLDGDGLPDIVLSANQWFRNLGNLTFAAEQSPYVEGWAPEAIRITSTPGSSASIHFFVDISDSIRITKVDYVSGKTIRSDSVWADSSMPWYRNLHFHAFEDLDRDGFPDLVLRGYDAGPYVEAWRLAVAWGSANGYSPLSFITPPPVSNRIVLTGDFDDNGSLDVIAGPDSNREFHLMANRGDGTFLPDRIIRGITPDSRMPEGTYIIGIKAANLDYDDHIDLAIDYVIDPPESYHSMTVRAIARGIGNGNFQEPRLRLHDFAYSADINPIEHLVDWDGDGWLDAIAQGVLQRNLGGRFSSTTQTLIPSTEGMMSYNRIIVGDLDGDGRLDIVNPVYKIDTSNFQRKCTLGIGYNNGQGGVDPIVEVPINLLTQSLYYYPYPGRAKIGDMNGDGLADLILNYPYYSDSYGNLAYQPYFRPNPARGSRTPGSWSQRPLSFSPEGPPVDFNGDLKKDYANLKGFLTPAFPDPIVSPAYNLLGGVYMNHDDVLYPGDFDGDGDTDFLVPFGLTNLTLVKNPSIEERSGITRSLIAAGVRPDKASPTADADGDGRDNQTELIFGTDPRASDKPSTNPLGLTLRANDGIPSVEYQIPSLAASLKVRHELEWSDDLIHWAPATGHQQNLLSQSNGWSFIQTTIPSPGEKGFYRIRGSHDLDAE